MSSCASDAAVVNRTRTPFWQAAQGDVRFPCTRVSQRQDVFLSLDELAAGLFQHQRLIQGGDRQEVETVQALDHIEIGLPDAALRGPAFAVEQFQFTQAQQVARKVHALGGAVLGHLVILAQECRQPQGFQMMVQQDLWRVHQPGPWLKSAR